MDAGESTIIRVKKKLDSDSLDEDKVSVELLQNFVPISIICRNVLICCCLHFDAFEFIKNYIVFVLYALYSWEIFVHHWLGLYYRLTIHPSERTNWGNKNLCRTFDDGVLKTNYSSFTWYVNGLFTQVYTADKLFILSPTRACFSCINRANTNDYISKCMIFSFNWSNIIICVTYKWNYLFYDGANDTKS